jgi:hypothetical protein
LLQESGGTALRTKAVVIKDLLIVCETGWENKEPGNHSIAGPF